MELTTAEIEYEAELAAALARFRNVVETTGASHSELSAATSLYDSECDAARTKLYSVEE